MNIGIIGCGLIGKKRANFLTKNDNLIACCDINKKIADDFSDIYNCKVFYDYKDLIKKTNCDIIIVAVINKFAKDIVLFALDNNMHVLLEKPMGINSIESLEMVNRSKKQNKILHIGFNLRFHPSIIKAKKLIESNYIGDILYIKGHYGHGGRIGMENEWRTNKKLCGGGELLDQGVHLIDLCRFFCGDIENIYSKLSNKYWNIDVEDTAFINLISKNKKIDIQLLVSWTIWKNSFSFDIYGTTGILKISGLGNSYGIEKITIIKKNGEKKLKPILHTYYHDNSFKKEWIYLKQMIKNNITTTNMIDGLETNIIIDEIYKQNNKQLI